MATTLQDEINAKMNKEKDEALQRQADDLLNLHRLRANIEGRILTKEEEDAILAMPKTQIPANFTAKPAEVVSPAAVQAAERPAARADLLAQIQAGKKLNPVKTVNKPQEPTLFDHLKKQVQEKMNAKVAEENDQEWNDDIAPMTQKAYIPAQPEPVVVVNKPTVSEPVEPTVTPVMMSTAKLSQAQGKIVPAAATVEKIIHKQTTAAEASASTLVNTQIPSQPVAAKGNIADKIDFYNGLSSAKQTRSQAFTDPSITDGNVAEKIKFYESLGVSEKSPSNTFSHPSIKAGHVAEKVELFNDINRNIQEAADHDLALQLQAELNRERYAAEQQMRLQEKQDAELALALQAQYDIEQQIEQENRDAELALALQAQYDIEQQIEQENHDAELAFALQAQYDIEQQIAQENRDAELAEDIYSRRSSEFSPNHANQQSNDPASQYQYLTGFVVSIYMQTSFTLAFAAGNLMIQHMQAALVVSFVVTAERRGSLFHSPMQGFMDRTTDTVDHAVAVDNDVPSFGRRPR